MVVDREDSADRKAVTEQAVMDLALLGKRETAARRQVSSDPAILFGMSSIDSTRSRLTGIMNDFGGTQLTAEEIIARDRNQHPTGWLRGRDTKFGRNP